MNKPMKLTTALFSICCLVLMSTFLVFPAEGKSIRDSISGELDLRAYYNDVSGNKDQSFLTEGGNVLTDLYFYYDNTSGVNDEIQWKGMAYLQGTDDPQFKIREDEVRLQNIYLTATKKDAWEWTGGYFSERFTQYTMNSVLLGMNGWVQIDDSWRFRAFGGRANRARPGSKHRRFAGGGRLEYDLDENHTLAVGHVQTWDDEDSLDGDELTGTSTDTETNKVTSIDYSGKFEEHNLRLSGEWARSDYETEPVGGKTSEDDEDARKIEARWTPYESTELRGKYEKVDPGFQTLSGFATTDRERLRFNWNQVISEEVSFTSEYEVWEDGLDGGQTHDVTEWEIDMRYNPEEADDAYWQKEFTVRYSAREDEGETAGLDNDSNDVDENVWDLEAWNRVGENILILGYTRDERDVDRNDSSVLHRYTLNFERTFEEIQVPAYKTIGIPLQYNLDTRYEEDIDENPSGNGDEVDRTVRVDNRLILAPGQREEFEAYHGYTNEHSDGSAEIVTESFGFAFHRILDREAGSRLSLSYDWTDNIDKGDSTQDYKEEKLQMRFTTPF